MQVRAKNKVIVPNGEEGLESKAYVDGIRLEHVSEFKYLGCVLEESGLPAQSVVRKWRVGGRFQVSLGP